ncbi:uncharacterized protein B0H18DRAFT_81261 [Fomitopsis serialis]|uniref:uncharacterized protein n=1 Tax=Fomitopsis serialis TaxID=139415 RepID=UPI002007D95B|nr:uncharacterized protein B0H18DRAFT_81261 [Neoantrodia serialis]KAH9915862.1 hypothetical protein B0H18DRAFT_81261 [Neoantrodia serialis]
MLCSRRHVSLTHSLASPTAAFPVTHKLGVERLALCPARLARRRGRASPASPRGHVVCAELAHPLAERARLPANARQASVRRIARTPAVRQPTRPLQPCNTVVGIPEDRRRPILTLAGLYGPHSVARPMCRRRIAARLCLPITSRLDQYPVIYTSTFFIRESPGPRGCPALPGMHARSLECCGRQRATSMPSVNPPGQTDMLGRCATVRHPGRPPLTARARRVPGGRNGSPFAHILVSPHLCQRSPLT